MPCDGVGLWVAKLEGSLTKCDHIIYVYIYICICACAYICIYINIIYIYICHMSITYLYMSDYSRANQRIWIAQRMLGTHSQLPY